MDTTMDDAGPSIGSNADERESRSRRSSIPAEQRAGTKKRSMRRPLMILGAIVAVALIAYATHLYLTRNQESTDDAQVEADVVPIAPQTGGRVSRLLVHTDQQVHTGDLLLVIDPRENQSRLAQARATLATAEAQARDGDAQVAVAEAAAHGGLRSAAATVSTAEDQLQSAAANVAAARAAVARARAQAENTGVTLARDRALFAEGAIAQAELDSARTADEAARAAVAEAEAQTRTAAAARQAAASQIGQAQGHLEQSEPVAPQVEAARARAALAHAQVENARAALAIAELQVSYNEVRAPRDGYVSQLSAFEGQLVTPGQPVAELVPNELYVIANFKETQIGRIHPGERAHVRIDAFGRHDFDGHVVSLSGGTGARFALLPPENASGNFVKIVQRVPIRIALDGLPRGVRPQAGLSVDVTVFLDR